jgi:hypothetical protein
MVRACAKSGAVFKAGVMQLGRMARWLLGGAVGMGAAAVAVLVAVGVARLGDQAAAVRPQDGDIWDGGALEYALDKLPAKGEAKVIPWTGSYWPTAHDSINYRWDGPGSDSPAMKYQKAFGHAGVEDAVSRYYGIDSVTGARSCNASGQCDKTGGEICAKRIGRASGLCIPTWSGICHGWAPAAILFPEPKHAVVKNGVTFKINDLKALASLAHDRTETKFISLRCDVSSRVNGVNFEKYGRPSGEACRETSAGGFHLLMANSFGRRGSAFAADRTLDAEVWNQPVRGYRVLEKREVSAQEANKLIGVKADPGPMVQKTGTVVKGQWAHQAPLAVSTGAAFKVAMSGSGDADLYVKFGARPTATSYDCRPFRKSSVESCAGTVPAGASKMFVSVLGNPAAATSIFTLRMSAGGQVPAAYQFDRLPAKLVYMKVDVDYISAESPEVDGYMTPHIDEYTQTDHYEYVLELDGHGRVTGGEWASDSREAHPDFLWLSIRASAPAVAGGAIEYGDVKALLDASVK